MFFFFFGTPIFLLIKVNKRFLNFLNIFKKFKNLLFTFIRRKMLKKFNLPLNLFIVFEKCFLLKFFSYQFDINLFFIYFQKNWFLSFYCYMKYELFSCFSFLIEQSIVDLETKKNFFFLNFFSKFKLKWIFYHFYCYYFKYRIIFFFSFHNYSLKPITSLNYFYKNSNWLERETSEMYGILFYYKIDSRKLLLEYSNINNPLLKTYSILNSNRLIYNFFENQITILFQEKLEL